MSDDTPMQATTYDHELKCWPQFFEPLWNGTKPFELRYNDREYKVGDVLRIREYNPETHSYTGRVTERRVSYILSDVWAIGLEDGYVVLGLEDKS